MKFRIYLFSIFGAAFLADLVAGSSTKADQAGKRISKSGDPNIHDNPLPPFSGPQFWQKILLLITLQGFYISDSEIESSFGVLLFDAGYGGHGGD